MRGTPATNRPGGIGHRFIPAHAGNSLPCSISSVARPVHPRACGELAYKEAMTFFHGGSSPRMRGTPVILDRVVRTGPVHPRACGELKTTPSSSLPGDGSSPRMRGTLTWENPKCRARRFIPAHAGNSPRKASAARRITVHPRACGELCGFIVVGRYGAGSSPRMRGTHDRRTLRTLQNRFIPAHAGNSNHRVNQGNRGAVHPRACGELPPKRSVLPLHTGSSPRMRGTRATGCFA